MISPNLPGKYCAFFRFVHGDNHRFGQKVWCDVLVEESPLIEFIPVAHEIFIQPESSSLLQECE